MSKITNAAKRLSTKKIFAAVIALVLISTVFTSTVFADVPNQYDVKVVDAGEATTVTTAKLQAAEVLSSAGIEVESDDIVDDSNFVAGEGGEIVISRLNTINVEFAGNTQSYDVYSPTVGEALSEIGATIEKKDVTSYSSNTKVEEGMNISILKAASVSITDANKTVKYAISRGTVADALKLAGVELGAEDYTEPSLDKKIKADSKIKVFRVVYKNETKSETVKYTTKKINDKTLAKGKTKVVTKGVNGKKNVTYSVKYINGKEDSKKKVSETVTKEAVQEVIKVGTKKTSKNGISEGDIINGKYTHYCACATCNGNSRGVTSSGKRIRNGMSNPYYVACNWLPLGTVIKVDGTKYTVVDRGGSGLSRKGRIDIFTPEGHSACYKYGTGSCKIEIVRLGW